MRVWMLCVGAVVLVGALVGVFLNSGHNPNHDINMEEARKAAARVHKPPKPGEKIVPGHGG